MTLENIKTVAVLGAGTMGNGIAHVFARAGYSVILRDVEQRYLERGLETVAKNLDREIKKGKLADTERAGVLGWRRSRERILSLRPCRKKLKLSARC
jgi:3-hydroxybutyryl-CoA dehydrogenase